MTNPKKTKKPLNTVQAIDALPPPKNKGGRPKGAVKYKTPQLFDEAVDRYFAMIEASEGKTPVTLFGLVLALEFCDIPSFYDYAHHDGFALSVKRARSLVGAAYEQRLHTQHPTGAIFALKNMGWKDTVELQPLAPPKSIDVSKLSDTQLEQLEQLLGGALRDAVKPEERA